MAFDSLALTMLKTFYIKEAISKDFVELESVNHKI